MNSFKLEDDCCDNTVLYEAYCKLLFGSCLSVNKDPDSAASDHSLINSVLAFIISLSVTRYNKFGISNLLFAGTIMLGTTTISTIFFIRVIRQSYTNELDISFGEMETTFSAIIMSFLFIFITTFAFHIMYHRGFLIEFSSISYINPGTLPV
jgi:hypothetical protein